MIHKTLKKLLLNLSCQFSLLASSLFEIMHLELIVFDNFTMLKDTTRSMSSLHTISHDACTSSFPFLLNNGFTMLLA